MKICNLITIITFVFYYYIVTLFQEKVLNESKQEGMVASLLLSSIISRQ